MTDVLLLTMLRAIDAGDTDTADECVSLAADPEAVAALLEDVSESYTAAEYELLTTEARAGLVLTQVGTHPRTGNPIMRYTRPRDAKPDKAATVAKAKATATALVRDGVKTPAQARQLADSLKQLSTADIDQLKRDFAARTGGRLKQDKVDRLVAYARGRGSVSGVSQPPPALPTNPPTVAELESSVMGEVEKGLSGKHAALRMVPIHEIRASLKAKHPDMTDDQFNGLLLDMRRQKKVRLVSIDDRSRATPQQLAGSVFAVGETFFYVERA